MKILKNIGLVWFIFSVAYAVHHWGAEVTDNPTIGFIILLVSGLVYAFGDVFDD